MGMKQLLVFILPLSSSWCYGVETITWERGVQLATEANSELKSAESSLQSARYSVKGARSGFLPVVAARGEYIFDSSQAAADNTYTVSVTATENLFSGFSDTARLERAKSTRSVSEAGLSNTKAKLNYDLKNAFSGLLYSQKYIALTQDIIKRRESNLKLVQLRFESGRENIGSLNLSKAYLAQSKYDYLQAKNSLDVYQAELARVLGLEDYRDLSVTGAVPVSKPPFEDNRQIDFKILIKDIPAFRQALAEQDVALADVSLARSDFYPSFNLTQTAGRTGREGSSFSSSWSVGANLVFPLFNGGKDYYASKSATEDYRAAIHSTKNIEQSNLTKLKDAYTKYVEAVMKMEVDEAFVTAASSRERIAKAQYNNGLITFTDWDTIENDLIIRQKTLLQTQKERVTAEAAWEQAQGRGVIP
jgi:outer membrane protein TolC